MPSSSVSVLDAFRPVLCGSMSRQAVSLGAAMHNAGYQALGLNWHYHAFEVHDVAGAIHGMRALGLRGLGVSAPFKQEVMAHLDSLSSEAQAIGAVNTVVNDGGALVGHNTDWIGAPAALTEALSLGETAVLVLGAGGAARAVAYGLAKRGCRVTLCNRHDSRGKALAEELALAHLPWSARHRLAPFAALVNASSCGMSGTTLDSPLAPDDLRTELVVMDIVYKPLNTQLLTHAREQGCRAISGERMLLHQAAAQFALYTHQTPPLAAMEAGLAKAMSA